MPKSKQFEEAEVLQKARDVFWKKGYNGTSMDELVKATGLSRSSIYDTFGDKHGLYLKSLSLYQTEQIDKLKTSVLPISSPRKKIEYLFQNAAADALRDRNRKGCFMLNSTTELVNQDKDIRNIACINFDNMEDMFYQWIKAGQASGEISKRFAARAIARHLFSAFNGLRVVAQTRQDASTIDDVVKLALSVMDR